MQRLTYVCGIVMFALLAAVLVVLPGCGGGGGTTPGTPVTTDPTENPALPGSISGTLYTVADDVLDYAVGGEILLTGETDAGQDFAANAKSTQRGTYRFASVPAGAYTVTASIRSSINPTVTVVGTVQKVKVRGNIPTQMVNLLLCEAAKTAVITGTITQNGAPARNATVTVEMEAYPLDHLQGNNQDYVSVMVATTTDENGIYRFDLPSTGLGYYVSAYSNTSSRTDTHDPFQLHDGETKVVDLTLDDAGTPVFADMVLDIFSARLPDPSTTASEQALITRMAVARATNAPATQLDHLKTLARTRRASRATGTLVENDLYWIATALDPTVQGYHIYRSATKDGTYTKVGSVRDAFDSAFYDCDPALDAGAEQFYTVRSYAANNKESATSLPIGVTPMPAIVPTGPADGATVGKAEAAVSWAPVAGAKSYIVIIFGQEPSFNILPTREPIAYTLGETSESLADLPAGTYWWSAAAYNATDPNFATAASFSPYRKITITQ